MNTITYKPRQRETTVVETKVIEQPRIVVPQDPYSSFDSIKKMLDEVDYGYTHRMVNGKHEYAVTIYPKYPKPVSQATSHDLKWALRTAFERCQAR